MKRARSYAEQHTVSVDLTDSNVEFLIQYCADTNVHDIIRIRFQFDLRQVRAWYCTCRGGPRVVGCCSHVAIAVWFLAYERHQFITNPQASSTNCQTLHYSQSISDHKSSPDENDDATYYSLRLS